MASQSTIWKHSITEREDVFLNILEYIIESPVIYFVVYYCFLDANGAADAGFSAIRTHTEAANGPRVWCLQIPLSSLFDTTTMQNNGAGEDNAGQPEGYNRPCRSPWRGTHPRRDFWTEGQRGDEGLLRAPDGLQSSPAGYNKNHFRS